MPKLGVNIDHVATVRQARLGSEPDVLQAAMEAIRGGADGITVHLREDRRHIRDRDVTALRKSIRVPLNLEMSLAEEIVAFAFRLTPPKVCIVPEKRKELTTEGGLAVAREFSRVARAVERLSRRNIEISLFIAPLEREVRAAKKSGAQVIELHTGEYAHARSGHERKLELKRLKEAASLAHSLGLGVNAGHGLNYENVKPVAHISHMVELNIGHSIVSRALFVGMRQAVQEMKRLLN